MPENCCSIQINPSWKLRWKPVSQTAKRLSVILRISMEPRLSNTGRKIRYPNSKISVFENISTETSKDNWAFSYYNIRKRKEKEKEYGR